MPAMFPYVLAASLILIGTMLFALTYIYLNPSVYEGPLALGFIIFFLYYELIIYFVWCIGIFILFWFLDLLVDKLRSRKYLAQTSILILSGIMTIIIFDLFYTFDLMFLFYILFISFVVLVLFFQFVPLGKLDLDKKQLFENCGNKTWVSFLAIIVAIMLSIAMHLFLSYKYAIIYNALFASAFVLPFLINLFFLIKEIRRQRKAVSASQH